MQIKNASKTQWKVPRLKLVKEYETKSSFYLWRAICEDFGGWHLGDETRFIY